MAPFSFFRYVFVSCQDMASGDFQSFILKHELAHVRAWHSLDRLFIGLGQIIQWFNPVALCYKKAVVSLHEFSADSAVTADADSIAGYQRRIMQYACNKNKLVLSSQLSDTITKKRFIMMTQQKSGRLNAIRVFFAAVLAAFLLLAFSSGDKILVKPLPDNNLKNSHWLDCSENTSQENIYAQDTTGNPQQPESDTRVYDNAEKHEDIRILSDELQEMKEDRRPDSVSRFRHDQTVRNHELFRDHMAQQQHHMADRQRQLAEMQRQFAEQQHMDAERLRDLKEGQLRHYDAERIKKDG